MQTYNSCGTAPDRLAVQALPTSDFSGVEDQCFLPTLPMTQGPLSLRGHTAMDHSRPRTLFDDPVNVQQWAASSANLSATALETYSPQHVNPTDTVSGGLPTSYPWGCIGPGSDSSSELDSNCGPESQRMCSVQDLDNDCFTQDSNGPNGLGMAELLPSYGSNFSDTPSLEWGPAINSNDSYAEDGQSSHFHTNLVSPVDTLSGADLFEGRTSLCSPSMRSVGYSSGSDFSPILMPSSAPMESSCGSSTIQAVSGMAHNTDDIMFQYNDVTQCYVNGVDLFASEHTSCDASYDTGGELQSAYSELSCSSEFPYPPGNAKAFVRRRLRNASEGLNARSDPLYFLSPGSDGLYHCPFVGGPENCRHKPDKLKCNHDKHLDSHLKPYRCNGLDPDCEGKQFSSTACLLRHQRERHAMHGHGDRPYLCQYEGCDRSLPGTGFPRHWNLNDHMKRVHNHIVEGQSRPSKNRRTSDTPASRQRVQKRPKSIQY